MVKNDDTTDSAGKFDFVTPVLVVVLLITAVGAFATDPPLWFFLLMLGIAFVTVAVSAMRNTILFKIGLRNMYRRKSFSVIVVLGLMIGTVIISSSLILGDTMNNMISSAVYNEFDQSDIYIYGENIDGSRTYISEADYSDLRAEIMNIDHVEGVTGEIRVGVPIMDINTQLSEPSMTIIGYNTTSTEFGYFHSGGKRVSYDLPPGQVYMNKVGAKALDAKAGDSIMIFTSSGPRTLTINTIVDSSGRGGKISSYLFMPLENAQVTFNVSHSVNMIKITNDGDVKGGEQYCKGVIKELEPLLKTSKYDMDYLTFNKITMAAKPTELQRFKDNTYGNLPSDFEMPSIMGPDMDPMKFYLYDQYLNSTDEVIMFTNWTDMKTYGMLAADLSDSPYVYGVAPELDIQGMIGSNVIGVLGQRADQGFAPLWVGNTTVTTNENIAYVNLQGAAMGISPNSTVNLTINGNVVQFNIKGVLNTTGRGMTKSVPYIFADLPYLQSESGYADQINIIRISATPSADLKSAAMNSYMLDGFTKGVFNYGKFKTLEVKDDKATSIQQGKDGAKMFTDMFLVFGSFSIIAGVILIVNIFVMLGEERKGEMGISRAVGMKRLHLKRSFMYEGSIFAFVSALIGAFLGIVVAWLVMFFLNWLFQSVLENMDFDMLSYFDFTALSIVTAFTFGALLTLITVSFTSNRIARLNIVRAIRNIPEPKIRKESLLMLIIGGGMLVFGILLTVLSYMVLENIDLEKWVVAGIYTGLSIAIFGPAFLLRRFLGDRLAFSIVSAILLVFWMIPTSVLKLTGDHVGGMEMFVLSGVFIVSSAVLLFLFNSTQILSVVVKLWGLTGRPTATLKTATAYPMKSKFRTGMTLYMFALVIFTITVMSMMVGMISYNIDKTIAEQAGGIDLVGIGNVNRPILNITADIEASDNLTMDDFNAVMGLSNGYVMRNTTIMNTGTGSMNTYQSIMGLDEQFMLKNKFVMDKYDKRYGDTRGVWRAVWNDTNLVVIDGGLAAGMGMGMNSGGDDMSASLGPVKKYGIGDNVTLYTPAGVAINKTVIGIMVQSMLGGVYMSSAAAAKDFNLTIPTFFFFDAKDGLDYEKLGKTLEKELHLEIIVVSILVKQFTNIMDQFFNLFSAFMGLGLIVGIAGLGIITLRAVHERRLEIGMMRAIGFKKRGVVAAFFMEASFIALMGIFLGTVLGIALGFNIWYDGFRPMDFDFYIAWNRIIVVTLIAYGATAALTIVPAFMASKIAPAEALRFE